MDQSGECPLCGWIWDPEELSANLIRREENAKTISEIIDRISQNAGIVSKAASNVKQYIEKFAEAAKALKLIPQETILRACVTLLSAIINACVEPLKNYPPTGLNCTQITYLCMTPELNKAAEDVVVTAKKAIPEVTPERTAWDTLTTLAVQLLQWQKAIDAHLMADRFLRRTTELSSAFSKVQRN